MDKQALLAESLLFSGLNDAELRGLAALTRVQEEDEGRQVFAEGSPGKELYLVVHGQVRVSLKDPQGALIELGTLGPGEAFGELSVLDGAARSATVTTAAPCSFLVIARSDLMTFIRTHPDVGVKLLEVLARRIRLTDSLIEDTLQFNLPARLANELLGLAKVYGQNTTYGLRINHEFTAEQLAGIVGVKPERIQAQLVEWHESGLVRNRNGRLHIVETQALERIR